MAVSDSVMEYDAEQVGVSRMGKSFGPNDRLRPVDPEAARGDDLRLRQRGEDLGGGAVG